MKIFVTFLLATIAYAAADISLNPGYNFQQQQSNYHQQQQQQQHSSPLLLQILSGAVPQQPQPQLNLQLPYQPPQTYLPPQQATSSMSFLPMPIDFPSAGTNSNFIAVAPSKSIRRFRPRVKIPKKAVVTKNFFIHSAPEESEDEVQEEIAQLAQEPRKHYNVLFVKTPAQTSKAAAVNLAKALKEEKTVVYVLSKKTTATDLKDAIAEAPQHINKPEVFFIKYRTPEEAANAQRQIQSQYDTLGGTSTITDEGVAPITSVVGSLDAPEEEESNEDVQQHLQHIHDNQEFEEQSVNSISNTAHTYLPPSGPVFK